MENEKIIRNVSVSFAFGQPSWYFDETDSIEEKDKVLVDYKYEETEDSMSNGTLCLSIYNLSNS